MTTETKLYVLGRLDDQYAGTIGVAYPGEPPYAAWARAANEIYARLGSHWEVVKAELL